MKRNSILFVAIIVLVFCLWIISHRSSLIKEKNGELYSSQDDEGGIEEGLHPLSIESLKKGEYPGSDLVFEQTLEPGNNYSRYIVSYKSEGLKQYALLTIPFGEKPKNGWPVVVFNHGYIPPKEYKTTERYIAYTDAFSRNGYIVIRPDYRGHGNSEGSGSGYGSNAYTIDVLNALASIKKLKDADKTRIGMWGHSMGGHITLRAMVSRSDIKAGVIWAGVVASYPDLLSKWRRGSGISPSPFPTTSSRGGWRRDFVDKYGSPEENPDFWNAISSQSFLKDISGPLQLHHGTNDTSVPYEFSQNLKNQLEAEQKTVELFLYPSDDHNISQNFSVAIQRSVDFFNQYVKGL